MKAQKKLNILLIVLIILLISLISFVGIYKQDKSEMVNIMPNYILGTNVKGSRLVILELKKDTNEDLKDESEAENKTEENEIEENVTENEDTKIGSASDYRKCADIIRKRLKNLKVENYQVSLDENTGKIEITIPENDRTDTILSDITQKGNFQIVDNITGEVLLSNKDVKSAKIGTSDYYNNTSIYMSVNFNNKGSKTFKDITSNYQNQIIENETNDNENKLESAENNEIVENGSEADNTTEDDKDVQTKKVSIKIDDSTLLTTHFSEVIDNGVLQLTMGISKDSEEIKNLTNAGANVAAIIQNEAMPLQYTVTGNMYIQSNISPEEIKVIIYVEIAIALIIMIYMIIKYKTSGILSSILSVGYIAILLMIIRLANVVLSLEGILGIEIAFIMNAIFNLKCLKTIKNLSKDDAVKMFDKTIRLYSIVTIPIAIIAVVCSLVNIESIYSFGMVMFWGIIISLLYNLIFTNILIRNKK